MSPVTKERFAQFLASYPRPLDRNVAHFYEPPMVTYNDFTLGRWPDSIVAAHTFMDLNSMQESGWMVRENIPQAQ